MVFKMKRERLISFFLLLSGCTSIYPLPVVKPSQYDVNKLLISEQCVNDSNKCPDNKEDNSQNKEQIVARKNKAPVVPQTYQEMLSFALAYRNVWHEKYLKLTSQNYGTSEIGFLGTLTALIAGVSGATTTAWIGGGVAAGTALLPERYQYSVQMFNYKSAADAAQCIYSALEILDTATAEYILEANFAREIGQYEYRKMQDVIYALENKQASVTLMTPDLTSFQNILMKDKKAAARRDTYEASGENLITEAKQDSKEKLISAITLCTTAVSGK